MEHKSKELQTAIDAAKVGAEVALTFFRKELSELHITHKEDDSVLTYADSATEKAIKNHILSMFPEAKFIAEESENSFSNTDNIWIIDPIDGTRDFSHGLEFWAVLIAHVSNGELTVGVAYFPAVNILIFAEKDKGCYVNNEETSVSGVDTLHESLVGFSPIKYFNKEEQNILLDLIDKSGSGRSLATSYLALLVSTSKIDILLTSAHNKIWDIAPFIPIIQEAGGKITDWEGNQIIIKNKNCKILATNSLLHDKVVTLLNT